MRPEQPYRLLRALVATALIGIVVGLWAYGHMTGAPMDMLWDVVVLALLIASGYTVFGRRTMDAAVETAQDLASDKSEDGGEE